MLMYFFFFSSSCIWHLPLRFQCLEKRYINAINIIINQMKFNTDSTGQYQKRNRTVCFVLKLLFVCFLRGRILQANRVENLGWGVVQQHILSVAFVTKLWIRSTNLLPNFLFYFYFVVIALCWDDSFMSMELSVFWTTIYSLISQFKQPVIMGL